MGISHYDTSIRQLVLSRREYDAIREAINDSITDDPRFVHLSPVQKPKRQVLKPSKLFATVRASLRLYLITNYGLKAVQGALTELTRRRSRGDIKSRKPLIAHSHRFALSLATLLFLHRYLYAFLTNLRRDLLHYDRDRILSSRWARRLYSALTWKLTPALGASLSGLALGIYPSEPLRSTVAIYVLVRAGELLFKQADHAGYLKRKPKWLGSWALSAIAQGQLLHAFVFDPECFPAAYGKLILANTPEYLQKRPITLPQTVAWPSKREIVDSLAEMARLRWPPYASPVLRPKDITTLPSTINPVITPITSRAHPALQHLSCALIHPAETSCFTPFLRQILLSFSSIGKFLTLYYGCLSLLRVKTLLKSPLAFASRLGQQILRSTTYIVGAIACAWGSICFFNNYLPRSFLPKSRFFLGGVIGGSLAIIDRSSTGHANNMYVLRTSLESLWKVGVKHRWWRSVKGGDVFVFVAALAAINMLYDAKKEVFLNDSTAKAVEVLRGDIEPLGLSDKVEREF